MCLYIPMFAPLSVCGRLSRKVTGRVNANTSRGQEEEKAFQKLFSAAKSDCTFISLTKDQNLLMRANM